MAPNVYAASCNPPRSTKQRPRPRADSISSSASEYLPEPRASPKLVRASADKLTKASIEPTAAAKRGRKPTAPLSRSAREAQRKLNHSIIEKARRTKINDALATLKRLVPADYGHAPAPDDEGADKRAGKREEKETGFKLEILVRTVAFMQDLLARVAMAEGAAHASRAGSSNSQCTCGARAPSVGAKRKRPAAAEEDDDHEPPARKRPAMRSRLPSISSWLPDLALDPALRPPAHPDFPPHRGSPFPSHRGSPSLAVPSHRASPKFSSGRASPSSPTPAHRASPDPFTSHLPSPPASAHVAPARPPLAHAPPALSLGPVLRVGSPSPPALHPTPVSPLLHRTPEDERAASLLLEIRGRPDCDGGAQGGIRGARDKATPASLLGLGRGLDLRS
ncbi:hypothetical protein B0H10DRAFT_2028667 [Mycena sp. CBHHK59/15]|nr:hypothetical protein B0H10DRAFT_2028667 [Mycena sp. CBHHK59/15]